MSIKLMTKVFGDITLKPTKKLIMLALADNANDDGVCYPFIDSICIKTGLSNRAVISNIDDLDDEKKLQKRIRAKKKGGRYSNIYLIYPLENYSKLDDCYAKYFSQSEPNAPISDNSQSEPNAPKIVSQSEPNAPKLTIIEPSLINEPSLSVTTPEKIANYLLSNIKILKPNFIAKGFNGWITEIERAMRIDNRTEDELIGCINWIYSNPKGSFWIPNILSGKKLREKFDTMESQMMQSNSKNEQTMKNLKIAEDIYNAK